MKQLRVNSKVVARTAAIRGQVGKVTAILGTGRERKYKVLWSNGSTGTHFSKALGIFINVTAENGENSENDEGELSDAPSVDSVPHSDRSGESFGEFRDLWNRSDNEEEER
jgi:hypothetical protein